MCEEVLSVVCISGKSFASITSPFCPLPGGPLNVGDGATNVGETPGNEAQKSLSSVDLDRPCLSSMPLPVPLVLLPPYACTVYTRMTLSVYPAKRVAPSALQAREMH